MTEIKLAYKIEELDEILLNNSCLLYGAGKVAKTVVKYAAKNKYNVNSILVSAKQGNPDNIMGISVRDRKECENDQSDKCLIVCMMEKLHKDVIPDIELLHFQKTIFISDKLFSSLTYLNGDYELEHADDMKRLKDETKKLRDQLEMKMDKQRDSLLRFVPRPCFEYMILNILDHCNLKCKGCDHFACVAEPYLVPYETIHRDLNRLAEIFHGDYIMKIGVMGGEPLLHPELLEILKDVRAHFQYTKIRLTTNGILLLKQNEEFWKVCRENKITIVNTKYPLNLDYEKMKEKAKNEKVEFIHFQGTGDGIEKTLFKKTIDLEGEHNPVDSFADCHISNYGNFLMEGKLYGCPFSCQAYRIFNKKFDQNLRITEQDYLDIYQVKSMQEVFDFAAKPKFFCRYCAGQSERFIWERSKQDVTEWIDES